MKKNLTILGAFLALSSSLFADKAYVANSGTSSVDVIKTNVDQVTAEILLSGTSRYIAFDREAHLGYVTNLSNDRLGVFDTFTDTLIKTIPVGDSPFFVTVNEPFQKVYVTNQLSNNVSILNTTNENITTVGVGVRPSFIVLDPDHSQVYVTNNLSSDITVLNMSSDDVKTTILLPTNPFYQALDPRQKKLYAVRGTVINPGISIIDTASNTLSTNIPLTGAFAIALDSPLSRAYVTSLTANTVSVFDTTNDSLVTTIPVGLFPNFIAINTPRQEVYVTNASADTVSVISMATNSVVATIPVGDQPIHVAFNTAGTKAYVANLVGDSISVIDTQSHSVLTTIPLFTGPFSIAILPDLPPSSPLSFTACQTKKTYLTQTVFFNHLSWKPSMGETPIVSYRIYRDAALTKLVTTIAANKPLCFSEKAKKTCCGQVYYIVAIDDRGLISPPASIRI